MSTDKINRLENQQEKQWDQIQDLFVLFWKFESTLQNIESAIKWAIWNNNLIITHKEKHKVTENRLKELEDELKENKKSINWINLKIAMVSWAWMIIMMIISKI